MRILRRKMELVKGTEAEIIATANPGCMLQLQAGVKMFGKKQRVLHVVQVLDEAYQNYMMALVRKKKLAKAASRRRPGFLTSHRSNQDTRHRAKSAAGGATEIRDDRRACGASSVIAGFCRKASWS